MNNTGWFSKEAISDRLTRICEPHVHKFFRANMFHVVGKDADLVIDFGMGLVNLRSELHIPPGKPVLAVATHVHVDHVGSFHEFETRLGHLAEAEAFELMRDADTLADHFRTQPGALTAAVPTGIKPDAYKISPAALTTILVENDVIDIGDACYTVLHLPGHSPGSIGLLDQTTGEFFSGDAIYQGGLVDDLPGCNVESYKGTMKRLAELDVEVVHGGHGTRFGKDRLREIAVSYLHSKGC
ncbi:glyoxylase-like metal-dependent hydrolase (beta-lactamase superfamily II) [Pararhizobium capsulatum DSM 1112]|uniref:Glyoxylase-like metal-dependent hydrolase (Beta-lactamase superfamily II) n=1 Tax=Pararhizobium capsulatum DSM 1112 TaxID=1121113 RepID=A0ABU0BZZ0_9HYPH|nr:MBL fold metallo-hydrolase [Pararhizobium capsulatum]MDQ0323838.1 glyoxylase-like metal-dependent hydrolase (beta-lactamase superfamily II) [Pararhizobium capsulatum DSM 1112]